MDIKRKYGLTIAGASLASVIAGMWIGSQIPRLKNPVTMSKEEPSNCVDQTGKDIFNDIDAIEESIRNAHDCTEAQQQAKSCAWGATIDTQTTGVATEICEKELFSYKPPEKTLAALQTMREACQETYSNLDGTMYISAEAFCDLDATAWVTHLAEVIDYSN
jgi:hypothetical protein